MPRLLAALVVLAAGAGGCQGSKGLCPSGQGACCHSTDDCDSASVCFPPTGLGCVFQPLPSDAVCLVDADCAGAAGAEVCEQVRCDLSLGGSCIPGCTQSSDCQEGEACSPTHHCVPAACTAGCPALFVCDTATSACLRRTCRGDSDCPAHAVCVDLQCHASLGQCGLID